MSLSQALNQFAQNLGRYPQAGETITHRDSPSPEGSFYAFDRYVLSKGGML